MKKSILIVAMIALLTSCSNTQPDPGDDPKNPEPPQAIMPEKVKADTAKVDSVKTQQPVK